MPAAAPAEPVKPVARKVAPAVKVEAAAAKKPEAATSVEAKVGLREVVVKAADQAARNGQHACESALVALLNVLGDLYRTLPDALETHTIHPEMVARLEALFEEL